MIHYWCPACVFMWLCVFLVSRRGHDVLRNQLPEKEEHVILVRLGPLQRALYTEFMNRFREAGNSGWLSLNPLKAFCVCCKVCACVCAPVERSTISIKRICIGLSVVV